MNVELSWIKLQLTNNTSMTKTVYHICLEDDAINRMAKAVKNEP